MQKLPFGKNGKGQETSLYVFENKDHAVMKVSDHGATLVSLLVPDRDHVMRDVVLGYDDASSYENNTGYFGATIGRNGNRIGNSRMMIDGKLCEIPANENENNLHSGPNGFDRALWEVKATSDNSITLFHLSTEEEQGFPGNLKVEVTYTLTDANAVEISYRGEADKTTVMNFTNHTYFNLNGHDSGSIEGQELQILADRYTPVKDSKSIPTGEIALVEGTPMDFRAMKPIGQDINADFDQIRFTDGYDHNFVLSDKAGEMKAMANAYCKESGIAMEACTDCCGVQFYAGNFITDRKGKGGADYHKRQAFCLESQFYPDAVNHENFPSPIVKAGNVFTSKTAYRFYVR